MYYVMCGDGVKLCVYLRRVSHCIVKSSGNAMFRLPLIIVGSV